MTVLIVKVHRKHPEPKKRLRIVPRWGISKTAKQIDQVGGRKVRVLTEKLALKEEGKLSNIPWSRLAAFHLNRLDVFTVTFEGEKTLAFMKKLTRAKSLERFAKMHGETAVVDLWTEEGALEYINHPLADRNTLLNIVNRRRQEKASLVHAGFKRLRADGKLALSELSARALFLLTPILEEQMDLLYILNNFGNASCQREAFLKLKTKGELRLSDLNDRALAAVFEKLEKKDYPYVRDRLITGLKKLKDGEGIGMRFIKIIEEIGGEQGLRTSVTIQVYNGLREERLAREKKAEQSQSSSGEEELDPDDFKGTGGTPLDHSMRGY
jgi:hypothetical protein